MIVVRFSVQYLFLNVAGTPHERNKRAFFSSSFFFSGIYIRRFIFIFIVVVVPLSKAFRLQNDILLEKINHRP